MPTSPDPATGWRGQAGLLRAAVQLLTRLPLDAPHGPDTARRGSRYFPLVGVGIGVAAAAVFLLAGALLPPLPAALAATAAALLLTGALHEDGLADTCDGLFGGRDRADRLRIMRDSRIGTFGVLGLLVVVGTKITCLAALTDPAPAIIAAHAASRFFPVAVAAVLPYARPGESPLAAAVAAPGATELAVAGATAAAALALLGPRALPALLLSAVAAGALAAYARRKVGGYTGDVLGAAQQVAEAAILLASPMAGPWHAA